MDAKLKPRNTKRGGKKNKKHTPPTSAHLSIYYNNINGFMTKRESLNQIILSECPDIIALCETKLGALSEPKIQGYESKYLNLKRGKEGLLIAAREGTVMSMENVSNLENEDKNILAVQVKYPNFSVRLIVAHAPQETDDADDRLRFFQGLKLEVERGELNGDKIVLMGDMNGRVNPPDSHSPNGESLKSLTEEHQLKIANLHPNTLGKWTRIQKKGGCECKSAIDFILLDECLYDSLTDMVVDECKIITPYWVSTRKGIRSIISSDHCAITAKICIDTGSISPPVQATKVWRITESGLEKYKEITSKRTLFFSNEDEPTEMYRLWWQDLEWSLDKCFKKQRMIRPQNYSYKSDGVAFVRTTLKTIAVRGKIQRNVVMYYKRRLFEWEYSRIQCRRVEKLKETLSNFSEDEKTPPNAYWKVLKSLRGKEKTTITSLVKNDGTEVSSPTAIKQEAIKEFQHRLRNRKPGNGWEEYVRRTNKIVEVLMTENVPDGEDFTLEELLFAIKKLKRKKSPGPDGVMGEFLIEAGVGVLIPLLELFNKIKKTKQPPDQWNSVLITIIYKNKGSRKSLLNYRGIFLASIVSKVFERLIKNRIQPCMKKVDVCQAGARSERGPPDNIFIVNSAIDHAIYVGKSIHLTTYDFEQAFDSLWLEDCILSLQRLGVPHYILQLIFNLNKEAVIQVKTPHGISPTATVKDTVQQGRVLAPDLCSASTAEYCKLNKGVGVGCCVVSSLAFVDDMLDMSEDNFDAEKSHLNALAFSHRKKIKYNGPKCKCLMVNGKKDERQAIMYIGNERLKYVPSFKYLGDIFQDNGKNTELVKDRISRGTAAILRIEAILSETQLGKHTIKVSLLLYRSLFLSSILFNSQAWRNLTEKDFSDLQQLQLRLLKKIVDAPKSVSSSFIFLELGVLPIRYEIKMRQITFLHHIVNLEIGDPVRDLYEQMKLLPGERNWLNNVLRSTSQFSIAVDEEHLRKTSKDSFKSHVKAAIIKYAFEKLKEDCAGLSKTKHLTYEALQPQPYLSYLYPSQSKIVLKCRAKCLKIKDHRPYLFKNNQCRWCNLEVETVEHIINCTPGGPLKFKDLNNIEDPSMEGYLVLLTGRIQKFLDMVEF